MKLENQVCSLDLAKNLKELGVNQDSLFYWVLSGFDGKNETFDLQMNPSLMIRGVVSAFTCSELGILIKECIDDSVIEDLFFVNEKPTLIREGIDSFVATTEADCRAKMLIHLIENRLNKK